MDEKILTIPLRKAFDAPRRHRRRRAVAIVREFAKRHAHADTATIAPGVSDIIWKESKPPRRIKIKLVKDGSKARVELMTPEAKETPKPAAAK